jgi:hypothetical protein
MLKPMEIKDGKKTESMCDLTLFKNSWQFFSGSIFRPWQQKRNASATHVKDFCGKNVPKLPDLDNFVSAKI